MLMRFLHSTYNFAIKAIQFPFISLFKIAIKWHMPTVARVLSKYFPFTHPIAQEYIENAVKCRNRQQLVFFINAGIYKNVCYNKDGKWNGSEPVNNAAINCDVDTLDILINASRDGKIDATCISRISLSNVIFFSDRPSYTMPDFGYIKTLQDAQRELDKVSSKKSIEIIIQTLEKLLNAGANINDNDFGVTTLGLAFIKKNLQIVEFLLIKGATEPKDISSSYYDGSACAKRCFVLLANGGFNINGDPLFIAKTKLLSTYQAPTNADILKLQPSQDYGPLSFLRVFNPNQPWYINSLLRSTYIVYTKFINKIDNHVKTLIGTVLPNDVWKNILSYLWEGTPFHEKVKSRLYQGPNLLHPAIIKQDIPQVEDIISLYPESIHACDSQGFTPLYYANKVGSIKLQQLLIYKGANTSELSNEQIESLQLVW